MRKNYETSIPNYGEKYYNFPHRSLGEKTPPLNPLNPLRKRQKPQISSITGVSPKTPNRYQVTIGKEIVATGLTCDEAFELVKGAR